MVTINEIAIAGKRGFSDGELTLLQDWMNTFERVHWKLHHYIRNQFNDDWCGDMAELMVFLTGKKLDLDEGIPSTCPLCYKDCNHVFNMEGDVYDHGEELTSMFCSKCGLSETPQVESK